MRFEKWQALGNDYVVVEEEDLAFGLEPARIRRLCHRHRGVGADGVLVLGPATAPGLVAALRIFNPDGSEAELSGNGARQAVLYLHRHGRAPGPGFAIQTAAGEVRATVGGPASARLDLGRARLRSADFPSGDRDGRGEVGGRPFQHVSIGNPQCAIHVADPAELEALDLAAIGPPIERSHLFPNRTNVSFWTAVGPGAIRARIHERGVGETLASGTGATGAAVAHVLRGGGSPVTVRLDGGELTVDVGEDLRVGLTGEATPVFAGTLSDDLVAALRAL